jgi:hypothetical protein
VDLLQRTALHIWTLKQRVARWAASRADREAWFAKIDGLLPPPGQLLIRRPGWRVRVSVWVRRGRDRGHRRLLQTGAGWEEGRARLAVVTVTASIGHSLLGYGSLEEIPEGVAPRLVFQRKPECHRKQNGYKNVIDRSRFRQGASPVAPRHHEEDLISRHMASTMGDLLFWLRPENVVLTGPRLSDAEDIESWIEAIVTKWEKEHGPSRRKRRCRTKSNEGFNRLRNLPMALAAGWIQTKAGMFRKTKGQRKYDPRLRIVGAVSIKAPSLEPPYRRGCATPRSGPLIGTVAKSGVAATHFFLVPT